MVLLPLQNFLSMESKPLPNHMLIARMRPSKLMLTQMKLQVMPPTLICLLPLQTTLLLTLLNQLRVHLLMQPSKLTLMQMKRLAMLLMLH